jgi:hypothetical protein
MACRLKYRFWRFRAGPEKFDTDYSFVIDYSVSQTEAKLFFWSSREPQMFAFKRSANRAVTLLKSRAFTSASSPKSRIRPLPVALGALAGSSLTAYYYMNTVDYHPVALTSDEELSHRDQAIKDVEELAVVKEMRARSDAVFFEAYGHLKGTAKLHNLTATVRVISDYTIF